MARSVKIDPLTRIEGHLAFRVEVENQRGGKCLLFRRNVPRI